MTATPRIYAESLKTWMLVKDLTEQDLILRTSWFNLKSEEASVGWKDILAAVVEMAQVSDLRDLMEQTEG
jgi:hypothetical protein